MYILNEDQAYLKGLAWQKPAAPGVAKEAGRVMVSAYT